MTSNESLYFRSYSMNERNMSDQQINFTQLLDTFQLFDTNKDGAISFSEVCCLYFVFKRNS